MRGMLCLLLTACLLLPCAGLAKQETPQKVVYLTFDDGPKKDTPELLAVLEALDVPATFFLLGASVKAFPEHARMIVEAGHAVGCHSMTHSYKRLRESADYAERDIGRFLTLMRETVGEDFATDLYRFPGGSNYPRAVKARVEGLGFAWFDWNAMNGDAQYMFDSDQQMIDYTMSTIGAQEDVIILLMHEGKVRTRRTLPVIVAALREKGYTFRALSTGEADRAILSRCPAHMMLPEAGNEGGM